MSNIPSAAIRITAAVIIGALIAGFMFIASNQGIEMQMTSINEAQNVTEVLGYDKYSRYNGETVTGAEISKLVEEMQNDDKFISVSNDGSSYSFFIMSFDYSTGRNRRRTEDISTQIAEVKSFVSPNALYNGTLMVYNNTVVGIQFNLTRDVATEVDRQHIQPDTETPDNSHSQADREFPQTHMHVDGKGGLHSVTDPNWVKVTPFYKGGCYTVPVYHVHDDSCIGVVHSHYYIGKEEVSSGVSMPQKIFTDADIIYDASKINTLNEALGKVGEASFIPDDGVIVDNIYDNGCYTIPVYYHHTHTDNCYTYKYTHRHVDANGKYTSTGDPNDKYPLTLKESEGGNGGCYVVPVYHEHTDNCYSVVAHVHSGSPITGTGCYTTAIFHKHTSVAAEDYEQVLLKKNATVIATATYEYTRKGLNASASLISADADKIVYNLTETFEKNAPAATLAKIDAAGFEREPQETSTGKFTDYIKDIRSGTYDPAKGVVSIVPTGDSSYKIGFEDGSEVYIGHKLNGYTPSTSATKYWETLTLVKVDEAAGTDVTESGLVIKYNTSGVHIDEHAATGKVDINGTCYSAMYYEPLYQWDTIKVKKKTVTTENVVLKDEEDYTWNGTKKPEAIAYIWPDTGSDTLVVGGSFVNTANGVRYKFSDGTYATNCWMKIDATVASKDEDTNAYAYHFNDQGYLDVNKGGLTGPKGTNMIVDGDGIYSTIAGLVKERNSERFAKGSVKNGQFVYEDGSKAKDQWLFIKAGKDSTGEYAYQYYFDKNGNMVKNAFVKSGDAYKYLNQDGQYNLISEIPFKFTSSESTAFTLRVKYGDDTTPYNNPYYGVSEARTHVNKEHTWTEDGYTYTAKATKNSTNPAYDSATGKYLNISDYVSADGTVSVAKWSDATYEYIAVPVIYGYASTYTYKEGCIYSDTAAEVTGTIHELPARNLLLSCGYTEADVDHFVLGCGYKTGDPEKDDKGNVKKTKTCGKLAKDEEGKGTGTIETYKIGKVIEEINGTEIVRGCTMEDEKAERYSNCNIAENTLVGYRLGCEYAEDNTGYICGKVTEAEAAASVGTGTILTPTIDYYTPGCGN